MTRLDRAMLVAAALAFAVAAFILGKITEKDKYIVVTQRPLEPAACLNPLWDFGVDSPAMRLFLMDHIPGVCFKSYLPSGDSLCLENHGKVKL